MLSGGRRCSPGSRHGVVAVASIIFAIIKTPQNGLSTHRLKYSKRRRRAVTSPCCCGHRSPQEKQSAQVAMAQVTDRIKPQLQLASYV